MRCAPDLAQLSRRVLLRRDGLPRGLLRGLRGGSGGAHGRVVAATFAEATAVRARQQGAPLSSARPARRPRPNPHLLRVDGQAVAV